MRRDPESNQRYERSNRSYDDLKWEEPDINSERVARVRERLQRSANADLPDKPFMGATKRKLNPKFVGALAAVGFAAVITLDTVVNGPSSFVVEHPEAATTTLAGISAVVGALVYKLTHNLTSGKQESNRINHNNEHRRY